MIKLHPGTTQVAIVDLDGVIFDHRHRDPLMPPVHLRHHNDHWLEHQSAENVAKDAILWHNVELVEGMIRAMWHGNNRMEVIALTSRVEVNRDVTVCALRDNMLLSYGAHFNYVDRKLDEHEPPHLFKAKKIQALIAANPALKRIVFIEDTAENVNAVMQYCSGLRGVLIQPVLLRPYS